MIEIKNRYQALKKEEDINRKYKLIIIKETERGGGWKYTKPREITLSTMENEKCESVKTEKQN